MRTLGAVRKISVDAATAAILSEVDGIFTLNEGHKMALRAFCGEQLF